jgi:WD40 repeat protein
MLATASFDGVVQLWQTVNYNNQPIVLNDHDSWVWSIEFSPDGQTLITGCVDKQIKEWPTNADKMAEKICYKLNRNMSSEEWSRYVAEDIPYEKTCMTEPENELKGE